LLNHIGSYPDAPLFCYKNNKDRPLKSNSISTIIVNLAKEANVECQAKDFRATMATIAAKAGMEPLQIMALGGWRNFQTVCAHYIHWNPQRDATDVLLGLRNPPPAIHSEPLIEKENDSDEEEEEGDSIQVIFNQ
jgi:hypothetical protein